MLLVVIVLVDEKVRVVVNCIVVVSVLMDEKKRVISVGVVVEITRVVVVVAKHLLVVVCVVVSVFVSVTVQSARKSPGSATRNIKNCLIILNQGIASCLDDLPVVLADWSSSNHACLFYRRPFYF